VRFPNGDVDLASSTGLNTNGMRTHRGFGIHLYAHRNSTNTIESMWVSFCSIAQRFVGANGIAAAAPLLGIDQKWSDAAFARETLLAPHHQAQRVLFS
jgi:hypothetical protein